MDSKVICILIANIFSARLGGGGGGGGEKEESGITLKRRL